MGNIPSHADWMKSTEGGFFDSRSDLLKAVDTAILGYNTQGKTPELLGRIRSTLEAYISEHQRRKTPEAWKQSIRNQKGAVVSLRLAVTPVEVPIVQDPEPIVVPPPEPRPVPVVRNPAAVAMMAELNRELQYANTTPFHVQQTAQGVELEGALTSLATDLGTLYTDISTGFGATRSSFLRVLDVASTQFIGLHQDDAKAIDAKLSIAKSVFDAMKVLPFPLSAIGGIGGAVTGALKTKTFVRAANYVPVGVPTAEGLEKTVMDAAQKFDTLRTMNVKPENLSLSLPKMTSDFSTAFEQFENTLRASWAKETEPVSDRGKRKALALAMVGTSTTGRGITTASEMKIRTAVLRKDIDQQGRAIEAHFASFKGRGNVLVHEECVKWVVVRLIADYAISGLCESKDVTLMSASELGGKAFGQKFAEYLADTPLQLLKTKYEKSSDVWKEGKIPWKGHPTHTVGVMLYLDWVRREVNPFLLWDPTIASAQTFQKKSDEYIRRLGAAIEIHHETHMLGHNTVTSVQDVARGANG